MPLMTGAMGARRYRLVDSPKSPDRDALLEALAEHAFRAPPSAARGGETAGWVSLDNLCITEFVPAQCWHNQYLCWSLRIDNKRLPPKLLRALLELRLKEWLDETGREKVPGPVKAEMREQLELELFPRQLPSVAAHDVCWDTAAQMVWFFSTSEKANEMFRTLFGRTFSLDTLPVGAVELIAGHSHSASWLPGLDRIGHSDYRPEAFR